MNNGKLRIVGYLMGLGGALLSAPANAQTTDAAPAAAAPAPPPEPVSAEASASTAGSAQVGMALPGSGTQAVAVAGDSDHAAVVGRLAIGYLGRQSMSIGAPPSDTAASAGGRIGISAPVIGIRYWLSEGLGIDAGLGIGMASGSTESMGASADLPGTTVFILHGGLPLSLASARHFSFQIVPELNVGFGSSSVEMGGTTTDLSGFHLDIGARAGAEIHFGFINVPQLSLQAGVGLGISMDSSSTETEGGSVDYSVTRIGTTVGDNPWNIFTSNVAALYYF
jgi:hypothetical protein